MLSIIRVFFIFTNLAYSQRAIKYVVQLNFYCKAVYRSVLFSIVRRFIQQEVQKMSIFRLLFSWLGSPTYSDSYLNWYNFCPCPFCVHFTPYRNCEDAIFVRWMEYNTPFPKYVLSCVFKIFIVLFDLLPIFVLYYELFLRSFCLGSDSWTRSQP